MNYEAELAKCQHSKLRAALAHPGQKAWPAPRRESAAEKKVASEVKFYLYTGATAVVSLMGFVVTAAVAA